MPLPPQSIAGIAERPHWTVSDAQAIFAPVPHGWRAIVRHLQRAAGARYHVAVVDRTGTMRYTMETWNLHDAVRSAERAVLARNALRQVPLA